MHIDAIRERFSRPPAEYSATPFWFLNDNLNEEHISSTLRELKNNGIFGVIIHPRTGMEVPYLSELYWERMLFICEMLKRFDMRGWLYDEYNWPSGIAGGKLLREHPEFRQFGLDYRFISSSRLEKELQTLPGQFYAGYTVSSGAVINKTEQIKERRFKDLSGEVLVFYLKKAATPMHASCCAPWTKGEAGYLDVLNSAAVDEFMRLTHFAYDQHIRSYYGNPIVGMFTDEPGNYSSLPFSTVMPEEYQKRYEEKFSTCLPGLAGQGFGLPVERTIRYRTNFFSLARDLFVNGYFKKMAAWAEERGLILTGHLNEDDRIDHLPATSTSFFAPLSQMHMPGIDLLEDRHGFDTRRRLPVHANFTPKAISSVSHHTGSKRTLCEIWGGNGWGTPPERLKAVLNWAQACGINFINPHAVFMSLRGLRKRDFPASHFSPQPWWCFYKKFADYISRLSLLNSEGAHLADVLFGFPLKSLWADFDLKVKGNKFADSLERASETLLRNQIDFDYLFDEFLDEHDVDIKDRRIAVGEESYSLLLLPLAAVIPQKFLELAEKFAFQGGRVLSFGYQLPAHDEGGREVTDRIQALFGENGPENAEYYHIETEGDSAFSWLPKKVNEWLRPDCEVRGPMRRYFACLHRKIESANCYFIANLSSEEGAVDLVLRCVGRPQFWNPEDGTIQDVLSYKTDRIYTVINRYFHPNEAIFVVITDEPPVEHVESTNLVLTSVTPEFAQGYASSLEVRFTYKNKRYTRSVEQAFQPLVLPRRWQVDYPLRNILLLDKWEVETLSQCEQPEWSPRGDPRLGARPKLILESLRQMVRIGKAIRRHSGNDKFSTTKFERLSESMDSAETWSKILGIDPKDFGEAEGILLKMAEYAGLPTGYDYPPPGCTYSMSTTFFLEHVPADLAVVYEETNGGPLSIEVNGHEVDRQPEQVFIWDESNLSVAIPTLVRKGENHLRLKWRQPAFPTLFPSVHGIEPVCLTGCFWVKKGKIIEQQYGTPAIPWADIGLPNYIGALTYRTSFDLPLKYMGQQLLLKFDRIKVAAEVKINEKPVGVLLWRPFVLDVTNFLRQGENHLEVTVANTAANLLAEPVPAGMIGRSYIVPYWRHRIRFAR